MNIGCVCLWAFGKGNWMPGERSEPCSELAELLFVQRSEAELLTHHPGYMTTAERSRPADVSTTALKGSSCAPWRASG